MSMPKYCYNCGVELNKTNRTKEHIPAKCLFEGYDEAYKLNRITVPGCKQCNIEYSKIDQEIRDVLAITNGDANKKSELTKKGFHSIFSRANWQDRFFMDEDGKSASFGFSYSDLRQIHIKNFKALFVKKYGVIVPGNFHVEIIAEGDDNLIDTAQVIHDYLTHDNKWDVSGHQDIFKFILKDITFIKEQNIFAESSDISKAVAVTGLLVYHDDVGAVVVAGDKEFILSCKPADM